MKNTLLIVSLCCLPTPCFGAGVAGLIAWGLLTLLFRAADGGVEQMASEIQQGNTGAGGCWFWLVVAFVVVGGLVVLVAFFATAAELRGVQL
jgi:hypothetical protein